MSEHHFGLGAGHLPERADAIADWHGAWLVNYTEPRGERRHWFACRDVGFPFTRSIAESVMADLRAAALIESDNEVK